jgi:YVTN family beta-propeller protein
MPKRLAPAPALLAAALVLLPAVASAKPTRSSSIALHPNGSLLVNVNFEANSVTVFGVNGSGNLVRRAEVAVGREPHCVAISATLNEAYVTNSDSGTVSVIALAGANIDHVVATINNVGFEPRACAVTPDGGRLLVAKYAEGKVAIIDPAARTILSNVTVGGNPAAIAISDSNRVFVTQFFARLIAGGPGEGFDDGKEGIVQSFLLSNPASIATTKLSPIESGFTANRAAHCNLTVEPDPAKQTFCPNTSIADPNNATIAKDPQKVYPNQLKSALICGDKLYLPNIGASPEPPVFFNTNVQALVSVVNANAVPPVQLAALHVNLNNQIKTEAQPDEPIDNLGRLFGNDLVAIDSNASCTAFYVVSRGGNYVIKATPTGPGGALSINAPNNVVRFQTGNIPTGIVLNSAGTKAYVNNEVNMSVSVIDLASGSVTRDVASSTPPSPGNATHSRLVGKLVFYTALGVADSGLTDTAIRNIEPLQFRGKQSDNAWSTCASCHDGGLADGVTWIFADGPRQTIPLDGTYSKISGGHDARILNWSAVRDSVTDFNNNSRGVQCGAGFAGGDPPVNCNPESPGGLPNPSIFDHGLLQGASEALDMETLWVQSVRPLNVPKAPLNTLIQGSIVFENVCASCHGGAKWTKSQIIYGHNPALNKAFAAGGVARDSGLVINGNQIQQYSDSVLDSGVLKILDDVGTFNAANKIEIRQNGTAAAGGLGFNSPSLLGVRNNAPYFHDGSAQTLAAVFTKHRLESGFVIQNVLNATQRTNLLAFLNSLDGRNVIFPNDTDRFKDPNQ